MSAWLFLRGLAREQRHWGRFVQRFEAEVPGAVVHCLDLPGAGTEHTRACPLSLAAMVRDVRARWLTLRDSAEGPWNLLGISLGGMVTLQWLGDFGEDFERAVVINTSAGDLSPPWHRMDLGVLPSLARAFREKNAVARERAILASTARMYTDLDALAQTWASFHEDRPMARINVLRQITAATRFRSPSMLRTPLLVLAAAGDPLARPACGRRIADKYRARFAEHPSAGHDLPLDDPMWVTTRVTEFVS
jgi:pimeloyl-ACP methyl ester carboxylesterase